MRRRVGVNPLTFELLDASAVRLVCGEEPEETTHVLEWSRAEAGLSYDALAARMGVKKATVQEYAVGRRPGAGFLFVVRWLKACGCDLVIRKR